MIIAVLAIIITAVIVFAKINSVDIASYLKFDKKMSNEAIVEKAMNYLNNSGLLEGQTASADSFSEESGMVKIKIKIGDNNFDGYATRDGKLFFAQAFEMDAAPVQ
ncbi:MAG: hypothetical protein A3D34_01880 [Candidatus Staskawiczbacteria bacterium RIFCSPHIGHO2_02_FULL_33_16]|uniref:Uncharacterized protein n=1 Tax=Candidatus Staskawiczbacteria bacterium RIFCSPHIGHO2_02_FULL_33_16 TaxID=1802204 RepID=A0A1G2HSA1_9BACT|nr:MAG: hypothetical protein A3D34_01880 [Candidatus Staskawiczbacteria bacterium RIFCSPHIGHO2_02_FULL_33_16]